MNTGKKITGQLGLYLQWPLLLSIMIVVMNTVIVIIDATAGLAMLGFTVIYLIIAIFLYVYKRKGIMAGLVEFSADYAWIQRKLLMDLHIPYAIVDESGRILWTNTQFSKIIKQEKGSIKTITAMFPDVTKEYLSELQESTSIHSTFGDSLYQVELKPIVIEKDDIKPGTGSTVLPKDKPLITVYLFDETEILRLG